MPEHAKKITFVIGGARSGKSSFALKCASDASDLSGKKAFIATAQAHDAEMNERIERHKLERGVVWDTFEEPLYPGRTLGEIRDAYDVIVVDCLTLWLSNIMLADKQIENEIETFCSSLLNVNCSLFIVSNEVGMGIVPENDLARRFRDMAGRLNQKTAAIADEVYLVVAGIPLRIK